MRLLAKCSGSLALKNKTLLRKTILANRLKISALERKQAVAQALLFLVGSSLFNASQKIACYCAQKNEFDCMPIIHMIWQAHKDCFLPVLSPNKTNALDFFYYTAEDTLQLNRYKILEPVSQKQIDPSQLDLVLVPLVGFDNEGNRLGMGGGYYDRTFMFLKKAKKPFLLGTAFEMQRVERLPDEPWDIKLNGVLTESGLYYF